MPAPRETRLLRVPDLQTYQRVLVSAIEHADVQAARATAVIVPSRAAAGQLRRSLETLTLLESDERSGGTGDEPGDRPNVVVLPELLTRDDWYRELHARLRDDEPTSVPPWLDDFQREVLMAAAARDAEATERPPFRLRPGLVAEMVRLYDDLRRLGKSIADADRLLTSDLSADADTDRGAGQLLRQTRFLVSTFRGYQSRLDALGAVDEHGLRAWLLEHTLARPFHHVLVAVADRLAEREGLWKADFDLLTRLPQVQRITVVATESLLATGFHERVHDLLPGIEEVRATAGQAVALPTLTVPAGEDGGRFARARDREAELSEIARHLKQPCGPAPLSRTAVVFRRPLPYVYLARQVFESAGIPFQTLDALPLAAEPYAAAVDLLFEFVTSGFSRPATLALLSSPLFSFPVALAGRPASAKRLDRWAALALDRALREAGSPHGPHGSEESESLDAVRAVASDTSAAAPATAAARVALELGELLTPLRQPAPASRHLDRVLDFLNRFDRPPSGDDEYRDRHLRARGAILGAVRALREAHRRIDDPTVELWELVASVRRWIEGQTFRPRTGHRGVQLVDAQAARFGRFDEVHLVGLVDGEWPDRWPRNIFYPPGLLEPFGWPREVDRLAASRAAFLDLVHLARRRVSVSTFSLEDDAIVGPSAFLDDLDTLSLPVAHAGALTDVRVFRDEALSESPVDATPLDRTAAAWLTLRQSRSEATAPMFRGTGTPDRRQALSIGALETYLECPFKYFARHVLRLDEDEDLDSEEAQRPRRHGLFLHQVFQDFFEAWSPRGEITLETLEEARQCFEPVAERRLAELPDAEAALERTLLFGSPAAEGLAEIVFRVEAESGGQVVERLLEHRLEGAFTLTGRGETRTVALEGVADRIDLLADGTLRVIDYKSGRAPSARRMLQLPIYSVCAAQQLEGHQGRSWAVGGGGYIAFGDARRFVPLADRIPLDRVLDAAQARVLDAVDGLRQGRFPPSPLEPYRCVFCGFAAVCRKDYVGDE